MSLSPTFGQQLVEKTSCDSPNLNRWLFCGLSIARRNRHVNLVLDDALFRIVLQDIDTTVHECDHEEGCPNRGGIEEVLAVKWLESAGYPHIVDKGAYISLVLQAAMNESEGAFRSAMMLVLALLALLVLKP